MHRREFLKLGAVAGGTVLLIWSRGISHQSNLLTTN